VRRNRATVLVQVIRQMITDFPNSFNVRLNSRSVVVIINDPTINEKIGPRVKNLPFRRYSVYLVNQNTRSVVVIINDPVTP